jgi:glycosyltransferase involved in cell wall biosynthesis
VIRPGPFFGRLKRSGHGLGKWLGYLDKFVLFPFALRRLVRRYREGGEPYVVHVCDHSNAMYIRWLEGVPHLVTCHDLLAIQSALGLIPGQRTGWTGRLLQRWILSGLRRAAQVVCVSGETRRVLLSLAPELGPRSRVIENPLNHPYRPIDREEAVARLAAMHWSAPFDPAADRYLFHVGGNQWYKNREGVLRIFGELRRNYPEWGGPLRLVMAGKPPTATMLRLSRENGLAGRVLFVEAVTNRQLEALYGLAEALIFPSLREGFGWPIIEAQACGTVVITSDRAPMAEVAGPAALQADPGVPGEFAARIAQALGESLEMKQRRRVEALRHAQKYDVRIFLEKICPVYTELSRN